MCICWEKCIPIVFLIIPFAKRIISGAEHKCTNVLLDFKWKVPAGEENRPPQLNFMPWKRIQSGKSNIYLPGLITSNAFAMCLQYIQGDVSDYHSSLSNYKTHQSKAKRSWDVWHLREEQAAGLPPLRKMCLACLSARRSHWVLLTSEPGSCEFRLFGML